ncbi:nuclear transport factor 2 family protein [Skermania sp. ID1734]|uniref:nuclear transport factor 2 family protein n=1 Tax=Skermania sp. ID1734 TaxID=2597516 RepID=UPI00163DC358|nr:nuclear transport factor 2 family protein [Skermania sp. ID1734]
MTELASATEVFQRVVRAVAERRQAEILDECYAEDVVVEHPFMVPEPTRSIGREQLRQRVASLRDLPIVMQVDETVVHQTTDPEVIVGEFTSHITSKLTGRQLTTANIMVLRVRDGMVVWSRDYHKHAVLAEFVKAQFQP